MVEVDDPSCSHEPNFLRNMGATELVNDPCPMDDSKVHSLLYNYRPTTWNWIRGVEDGLHVRRVTMRSRDDISIKFRSERNMLCRSSDANHRVSYSMTKAD